jgi:hypothetical protein
MRTINGRDVQFLLLIAALPIFGFQFGIGNQVEQLSLVRRLADPTFLRGDFYVDSAAGFGPRFYFCLMLAWLTKALTLPGAVFGLTFLTNLTLAGVSFDAARRHLGADRIGGAIAALTVIVNSSFALGLAGYIRFQSYQPASIAIALALVSLSCLLAQRRILAGIGFAAAALFHPLIGVETAAVAYAACGLAELTRHRRVGEILRAWLAYLPSMLILALAVAAEWILPSKGQPRIPDAELFDILVAFRAPHHYLAFGFPISHYLTAAVFVAGLSWLVIRQVRLQGLKFELAAMVLIVAAILGLCAASALFVDVLHNRAFATAQTFRMLLVVKWIGLLLFAAASARWLGEGGWLAWIAALVPVLATGDAQPLAMAAAIAVMEGDRRLKLSSAVRIALAAGLVLFAAAAAYAVGAHNEILRAAVGAACLWLFFGSQSERTPARAAAWGLVAALLLAGWFGRFSGGELLKGTYTFADLRGADVEVCRWVKANTPPGSVWITPPEFENFRLVAERPMVVDFTSLPFQELAMREWRARMRALYGEVRGGGFPALHAMEANYRSADPVRLRQAAAHYGATYAVLEAQTPWPETALYSNAAYKVVRLR